MQKMAGLAILALLAILSAPGAADAGRSHVFVGGGFWVGPPPYGGPPPFGPRHFYPAPVVVERWVPCGPAVVLERPAPPPGYAQREEAEPDYWYYCENPRGYYPYVRRCPEGWMRVVPDTVPPDR
jgi:hypothetical protein